MNREEALRPLRREWLIVAVVWAAAWLLGFAVLAGVWPTAGRWLFFSGLTLAYLLWVLWRHLPLNHRPDEAALLPTLGAGNHLSLVRALCLGLVAGFLFGPWPPGALAWVIVLLYTITDIADYFDGYLARRANHITPLGGRLDIEIDGLGTLIVILLAISFGQLPWWYLGLGLARYFFLFGIWWRRRRGRAIHDLAPSVHRRVFAGFQMGFLSVVLWPIVPRPAAVIAGTIFAAATATGFLRDWLVTSGRIVPTDPGYRRVQGALFRLFGVWLPLVWRALLVLAVALMLVSLGDFVPPPPWHGVLISWRVPGAYSMAAAAAGFALLGAVLIALGAAGRLVAIPMAFPIAIDISARGLRPDNGVALVCIIFIMLIGTGPYSLWKPEQPLIDRRLGE